MSDADPSTADVKRALRRLAFSVAPTETSHDSPSPDAARIVSRGIAAVDDIETAAAFLTEVGLTGFEQALSQCARAGHQSLAESGRDAAVTYRAFRRAANHFHAGRGTPLRRDAK